jgi:hypothetical protein
MVSVVTEMAGASAVGAVQSQRDISKPKVLVLSGSALTDRMFFHTKFFAALTNGARASVWAASAADPYYRSEWETAGVEIEEYPKIYPFKEFPYNFLRRLNEYNWDYRLQAASRLSMMRVIRDKSMRLPVRVAKYLAHVTSLFPVEERIEDRLEKLLLSYDRSPESIVRLRNLNPDVVVCSGPFQYSEPAITAVAKKMGIPVLALIPSWDNLSTKNRLVMKYDGYIVWSEWQREELHQIYPASRSVPCYVVGAPQFDVFYQEEFNLSRASFCETQGLDPNRPIILYAIGSPNLHPGEKHGALELARIIQAGKLGDVQMIVRPHPLHDVGELKDLFTDFAPQVILQQPAGQGAVRSQDRAQIIEWVNSFRHADVHINTFSTTAIDAAICDTPTINLDYDPAPGKPHERLVQAINHEWVHYKPIAESGGVWLVKNTEELLDAVKIYLREPELHRVARRGIAEHVCEYLDGQCGERFAQAILDFVGEGAAQARLARQ